MCFRYRGIVCFWWQTMDNIKTKDLKDGVTITVPVDTYMIDLLKTEILEGKFITII